MPIKLPKGFNRRKSSGNALEESSNPPQSSFRVFERPSDGSKSFDGGNRMRRKSEIRPYSEGQSLDYQAGKEQPHDGLQNRGSGGTQTSASSSGLYDTSSSSPRYSSSSTLPSSSSLEAPKDDQPHTQSRNPRNVPLPPVPTTPSAFSLLGSSRTFSFGAKKATQAARQLNTNGNHNITMPEQNPKYSDIPDIDPTLRPRAMTETSHASTSTATPPKLFDGELNLSFTEEPDGFGNMFDGFDLTEKRKSKGLEGRQNQRSLVDESGVHPDTSARSTFAPPPPVHVDRFRSVTPALPSATSHTSRDGLMNSSPQQEHFSYDSTRAGGPKSARLNRRSKTFDSSPTGPSRPLLSEHSGSGKVEQSIRDSYPIATEDARLVMQYMNQSKNPSGHTRKTSPPVKRKPAPRPDERQSANEAPNSERGDINSNRNSFDAGREESIDATPKGKRSGPTRDDDKLEDDLAFQEMARSAARYESGSVSPTKVIPTSKGKVMTPAQFERYRREQESYHANSVASKSEDSDDGDDNYSEDDEEERTREMVKQRKKQEAHLSVYRQQMMKVTGEHQPLNRPASSLQPPGTSLTSPSLATRQSVASLRDRAAVNKSSDDDEDEDIPLGILAAHGFPSKEKSPSHLTRSGTQPTIQYSSDTYPPPVPPGSGLPAFARNLPKDPYYGASIVNPSNRESLAFGSGSASVYGGSQAGGPSNIHPGGLVGVIAKEERARALRRGSPNSQTFDTSNAASGLPGGMMPMVPPPFSPDQQAQMHMSNQMTQMMQMQMQWMQQMMAMQGMQGGQQMPPMPGMPGMPMMPGMPNSMSMPGMPPMPMLQVPGQMPQPHSVPTTPMQPFSSNHNNQQRPTSTGSAFASARRQSQSRAMSMLSPDGQPQWARSNRSSAAPSVLLGSRPQQPGIGLGTSQYAPSIAPSERSNVGQPSRYRPVSTMPPDDRKSRASTMGSGALLAWEAGLPGGEKDKAAATVRMVQRKGDDEDEEEGWEEMKRKREGKKRLWHGKKGNKEEAEGLEGVFYPVDS